MNKKLSVALVSLMSFVSVGSLSSCGDSLVFFNWGAYIDPEVISDFTSETGIKVKMENFQDNEAMITKVQNSSYDVVVPSDYAIEEMAQNNMIKELDLSKFSNYSEDRLISSFNGSLDSLKSDGFDMLKYAVPYTWGEVGLIYDSSKISEDEIKEEGWEALRTKTNKDGSARKVCLYDESRDVYSVAMAANGINFVNPTTDQLSTATSWLNQMKTTLGDNLSFGTDDILDSMPNHQYDIVMDYSGDAFYCISNEADNRSDIKFYIPDAKEGSDTRTNIFTDALVITSNCKHEEWAYQFIDFLSKKENAVRDTNYIGYVTPFQDAFDEVTGEGGDFENVDAYKNIEANSKDHFYRYDATLKATLENMYVNIRGH